MIDRIKNILMNDIDDILSRHFSGYTTKEEELLVSKFKSENLEEYKILQTFWTKKEIELTHFNSDEGWKEVIRAKQKPKTVKLFPYRRWIAVAASILLLLFSGKYLYDSQSTPAALVSMTATTANQKIVLKDGSVVHLNKDTSFEYPENFSSTSREVKLQGEAFFEVAKDTSRPFRILTNHSEVEVLGTSFNIKTEDLQTEISVKTGKVKVSSLSTSDSAILIPQQSAIVNHKSLDVQSTENINYLAWKTGEFHFDKAEIKEVVQELNQYYKEKIILKSTKSECLLSTTLKDLELQEIMEIIELSCDLKMNVKNGTYELH